MTYACLGIYKFTAAGYEQVLARAETELSQRLRAEPGICEHLLCAATGETLVSLSTWNSREQAKRSGTLLADWAASAGDGHLLAGDQRQGELALVEQASADTPAFLRVTVARLRKGTADDIVAKLGQSVMNFFRSRPGFVVCQVIKVSDDSGVLVTGWRSKAEASARLLASAPPKTLFGTSLGALGRLLFSFVSFDVYVGEVLQAQVPAA